MCYSTYKHVYPPNPNPDWECKIEKGVLHGSRDGIYVLCGMQGGAGILQEYPRFPPSYLVYLKKKKNIEMFIFPL